MIMNLTISKLGNKYGLSRSTLLYYNKIGLLLPCSHQKGEYRTYGVEEQERLRLICLYRKSGISLKEIKQILDNEETSVSTCLIARFKQLDRDIMELKEQQTIIANMLQNPSLLSSSTPMTKELWTRILKASGISEKMMRKWHIQFEKAAPGEHLAFLKFLQISDEEIEAIRNWTS
jgi:DNA-binding transcriptional MerR regulator